MKVREGQRIPWGYGYAYDDISTFAKVFYPFPFNFLARWYRRGYWYLLTAGHDNRLFRLEQQAYIQGYKRGEREGYAVGYSEGVIDRQGEGQR